MFGQIVQSYKQTQQTWSFFFTHFKKTFAFFASDKKNHNLIIFPNHATLSSINSIAPLQMFTMEADKSFYKFGCCVGATFKLIKCL